MEKIKAFINWLFGWDKQSSKNTLKSLDPEQLRRERIKAEQAENQLNKEIDSLEQQKAEFFNKGVSCPSDRQKKQYARKIKQLESQIKGQERHLSLINRNVSVINGVIQLKENEHLLSKLGMDELINRMDLGELHQWIEEATVEGKFQMEKFEEVLGALSGAEAIYDFDDSDEETDALVAAMNEAADLTTHKTIAESQAQVENENPSTNAKTQDSQRV